MVVEDTKKQLLDWVDAHGVDTSADLLKIGAIVTAISYFFINVTDLLLFLNFVWALAYILYVLAKPKWFEPKPDDITEDVEVSQTELTVFVPDGNE